MAIRRSQALSIALLSLLLAAPVQAGQGSDSNAVAALEIHVEEGAPSLNDSAELMPRDASASEDPVVDPAADPWLAEQGPAVSVPVEEAREKVRASWQDAGTSLASRATAVRRARLEFGLGDQLAPALAILRDAPEEDNQIYTGLARELAPGIPSINMTHATALWQAGDTGAAIHALMQAGLAAATHLEVQIWCVENLSLVLLMVALGSSFGFMLLAALMVFPDAAHDLGDLFSSQMPGFARWAALAALLLIPFVIGEGVVGFTLALFAVAFAYGKHRQRSALVMAAVLFIVGLHPTARLASISTTLLEQDAVLNSVLAVANGIDNHSDVERLERASSEDLMAAHALAYRDRRYGLEEEARQRLDAIAVSDPGDPVMLTNRGNIEMRRGNTEEAIADYMRASTQENSPTILFDLSQAFAASFRMEEYESTLARGQALDDHEISDLSSLGDASLVADLGMPFGYLQKRLIARALVHAPKSTIVDALAPGRLGERWFVTAGAFALVALLCLLFADRFEHASLCTRCGRRICTSCEETVWSDEICEDCHHLFQNAADTDPLLRMARLQILSRRDARLDRIWLTASLLIPGAAGFASKRPDLAMFGLLLFGWTTVWLAWPRGILVDPMLMGSAAWIFIAIPGGLAMLAYFGVVLASLVARKNL